MTGCPSLDLDPSSSTVRHPFVSSPSVPRDGIHARTLDPLLSVDAFHCLFSQGYVEIFVSYNAVRIQCLPLFEIAAANGKTVRFPPRKLVTWNLYGPQGTSSNWRLHGLSATGSQPWNLSLFVKLYRPRLYVYKSLRNVFF